MRSIEVHIIENGSDIDTAFASGLLESTDLDIDECSACSRGIGHAGGISGFVPFALVQDEADEPWFVCTVCAAPVTDSADGVYEPYEEPDEEFDEFTLFD
jgi:hypothetical protein